MKIKKLFDKVQVDQLKNSLVNAPIPARKLTQKETVIELLPTLKELLERGHDVASIAAVLAANGLLISARALSLLMRDNGPKDGPKRLRRSPSAVQTATS